MQHQDKQNKMLVYNAKIHKKYRQSNNLIESPYSQEFSAHEIKIFEIAAASCGVEDANFVKLKNDKEFALTNIELARLLNTKPNVISMEIEKTAARIMKKAIHLRNVKDDGSVEFQMINIVPYAEYKNGVFRFRLNYSIIPYLVEINKNFTEFQLHNILSMTSSYAIKLYKLLYRYKNLGRKKFTVDNLKEQFGVINKYKQYSDLKKYVIESSVKQINTATDLSVNYTEIKFGRKVSDLEFTFYVKKSLPMPEVKGMQSESDKHTEDMAFDNEELNSLFAHIEDQISQSTKNVIKQFYNTHGILYIRACVNYVKNAKANNFDKYLLETITNNWAEVEFKKLTLVAKKKVISSHVIEQENQDKKNKEVHDKKIRQEIELEWARIPQEEQKLYTEYAQSIIEKNNSAISSHIPKGINIETCLPLCVYAKSNQKSYIKVVESAMSYLEIPLIVLNQPPLFE